MNTPKLSRLPTRVVHKYIFFQIYEWTQKHLVKWEHYHLKHFSNYVSENVSRSVINNLWFLKPLQSSDEGYLFLVGSRDFLFFNHVSTWTFFFRRARLLPFHHYCLFIYFVFWIQEYRTLITPQSVIWTDITWRQSSLRKVGCHPAKS